MSMIIQTHRVAAVFCLGDYYAFPRTRSLHDFMKVIEEIYPDHAAYPHIEMIHFGCLDAPLP